MNKLLLILDLYIFFSIIVVALSIFLFLYTKKYSEKKVRIFGLFLDLSKIDSIILGTNLLHFIVSIYCLFNISNYGLLFMAILICNSLISVVLSFNLHLIIAEVVYTSITLLVLTLLNLINTYLDKINYDTMTHVLSIVFMITIGVYLLFISVRKLELVLNKNKYVRRNI